MQTKKLSAIVFADIVGYTAMMGKDEKSALQLLGELRTVIYPLTASNNRDCCVLTLRFFPDAILRATFSEPKKIFFLFHLLR